MPFSLFSAYPAPDRLITIMFMILIKYTSARSAVQAENKKMSGVSREMME
jgi:hypothetical protein